MTRRWLLAPLVFLLAAACGGGSGDEELSAGLTETVAPTLPPIATRAPEASATPVNAHAPGTRTGIPVVDGVLGQAQARTPPR